MSTLTAAAGIGKIEEYLGSETRNLLDYTCKGIPKSSLHLPGPAWVDQVHAGSDRPTPVLRSLQALVDHGRLAGTGYVSILPVDQGIEHSAGASFAKNPALLRPREHREARDRGRLQRGRLDARRPRRRRAPVRAQDPVPPQVQPQRVPDLPEQVRPDLLRLRQAGEGHGCRRGGGHDLLRLRPVRPPDRRGLAGVPGRARDGDGDRAVVLPPEPRLQDEGEGLPRVRRPHRPGEPPRGHDRGGHHQAEAARRTTAATTRSAARRTPTARPTSGSTPS